MSLQLICKQAVSIQMINFSLSISQKASFPKERGPFLTQSIPKSLQAWQAQALRQAEIRENNRQ